MKHAVLVALLLVCAVAVHAQLPQLGPVWQPPNAAPVTPPLQITSTGCPTIVTGQPYQCQFTATGGTPPYHWSIVAGAAPPGLTLSDSGLLSGVVNICSNVHPTDCFISPPQQIQMILAGGTVTIPVESPKHHAKKKKIA